MEKTFYTPQEVADILKITRITVYSLMKKGQLNSYKIGSDYRITSESLDAYLERIKVKHETDGSN